LMVGRRWDTDITQAVRQPVLDAALRKNRR
jgi:hypothetical protein